MKCLNHLFCALTRVESRQYVSMHSVSLCPHKKWPWPRDWPPTHNKAHDEEHYAIATHFGITVSYLPRHNISGRCSRAMLSCLGFFYLCLYGRVKCKLCKICILIYAVIYVENCKKTVRDKKNHNCHVIFVSRHIWTNPDKKSLMGQNINLDFFYRIEKNIGIKPIFLRIIKSVHINTFQT